MAAGAREVVRLILAGDASGFEGAVGKAEGAGGRMRAVGATIAAAGAAMAAAGFSVGKRRGRHQRDQIIATIPARPVATLDERLSCRLTGSRVAQARSSG